MNEEEFDELKKQIGEAWDNRNRNIPDSENILRISNGFNLAEEIILAMLMIHVMGEIEKLDDGEGIN